VVTVGGIDATHAATYRPGANDADRRSAGPAGFGLPAACFAMYRMADADQKKSTGAVMGSAGLTSFLTGVTEPIEFSFLFVAPVLYAIHALLRDRGPGSVTISELAVVAVMAAVWWGPTFVAITDLQKREEGVSRPLVWKWYALLCVPVAGAITRARGVGGRKKERAAPRPEPDQKKK
jgi:phosphotransferase system  glucose/maltose/N-acetylglucosamine-specific IIC component